MSNQEHIIKVCTPNLYHFSCLYFCYLLMQHTMALNTTTHHGLLKTAVIVFPLWTQQLLRLLQNSPVQNRTMALKNCCNKNLQHLTTIILCLILPVLLRLLLLGRHFWLPIFCTGLMKTRSVGTWPYRHSVPQDS
jgi:hypothetical protein